MKKFIVLILSALVLTFVLAGCGGSGDSTGTLTVYFHFQDQDGNGISGLKLGYTNPSGSQITSPSTNESGDFSIEIKTAGTYTITTVYYNDATYNLADPAVDAAITVDVSQEDIDNNKKVKYTMPIDLSTDPPTPGEPIEEEL